MKRVPEIAVYSCVVGRYDRELMPVEPTDGIAYVCFTDAPASLEAEGWELRPLRHPPHVTGGHAINRWHKIFAHRLFPGTRWSVYLDGNLRFAGSFSALVDTVEREQAGLGAFRHPDGHDLEEEIAACRKLKFTRRDLARIDDQIEAYRQSGLPFDRVIPTNSLLVRDHTSSLVASAMDLWWDHICRFTRRDQVSLPFVIRETGLPFAWLDGEDSANAALLSRVWHSPPLGKRIERRLRSSFGYIPRG